VIRVSRLLIVGLFAATTAACSTISAINPFDKGDSDASLEGSAAPEERKRIPLLALDQTLTVADALKGVGFYLPPPTAIAESPLPGGNAEQAIEHSAAAPAFQVAWRRKIGQPSKKATHITAPPVVAAGRVYTLDAEAGVGAFDAQTGAPIWRVDLNPHIRRDGVGFGGGLAYADGRIYVASGFRFVAALDAATGAELWRTQVNAAIHGAPTIALGRLYVININNQLQAFDLATGKLSWQYQALIESARILKASSPAVSGDTVIGAFASGELTALRAANGTELWSSSLTRANRNNALSELRDIAGRPAIYRGDIFAASHSGVFAAVDFRTGNARWELPVISVDSPWPAGDVVYIVSKAGEVICVSRSNGQVYWIRDLNEGRAQTKVSKVLGRETITREYWTGAVLASNRLISVSNEGRAVAMDPKTGAVQTFLQLGGSANIAPVAAGGLLYVLTDEAELVAIR
jgi:outer membrane protein assembly factor BamB